MTSLFQPPAASTPHDDYKIYGFSGNPFAVDETLATIGGDDDADRFKRIYCAREIARLAARIQEEALAGAQRRLWLKEDETVPKRYNNVVTTGVFRALLTAEAPRLLPVYVPVPQVFKDLSGGVYNLLVDRLLPRYLKNATYAFVYQELAQAGSEVPFDAAGLRAEMDATRGVALDMILYGREFALTEAEEYGVEEEVEEIASGEVASSPAEQAPRNDGTTRPEDEATQPEEAIEEAEAPVDDRRQPLLEFIGTRLNDEAFGFGPTLRLAISTALADNFVRARMILEQADRPKDELLGLIRFASRYYNGVVVLIDQLDPWTQFTEPDRIKFLSSLHEFDLISGGRAVTVMLSNKFIYDSFDARFRDQCVTLPLHLSWVTRSVEEIGRDRAVAGRMFAAWLAPAGTAEPETIAPLTAETIDVLLTKAQDSPYIALELARELVERGRAQGRLTLDGAFASQTV